MWLVFHIHSKGVDFGAFPLMFSLLWWELLTTFALDCLDHTFNKFIPYFFNQVLPWVLSFATGPTSTLTKDPHISTQIQHLYKFLFIH